MLELDDDMILISLLDGDVTNLEVVPDSIDLAVAEVRAKELKS